MTNLSLLEAGNQIDGGGDDSRIDGDGRVADDNDSTEDDYIA